MVLESGGQLPLRVRSMMLKAGSFQVSTSSGEFVIPRDLVVFISFGIIDEEVGFSEARQSGLRKMIRGMVFGEEQVPHAPQKSYRHVHLMDVFVKGEERPFRIDGTHFNYRLILDEVGHNSNENFRNLMASLISLCPNCYFTRSVQGFILRRKEDVKHYNGVYDFETDSQQARRRMDEQIPCKLLRLDERIRLCRNESGTDDAGEKDEAAEGEDGEKEDNQ